MADLFSPTNLKNKGKRPLKLNGRRYRLAESWSQQMLFGQKPLAATAAPVNHKKLLPMLAMVVIFPLVMMSQLFNLQVVNGERMAGLADGNRLRQKITYAPRGRILDRYGVELAANTASFQLVGYPYLLPKDSAERQRVYDVLAGALHTSSASLRQAAEAKGLDHTQPVLIKDQVGYSQALVIEQKLPTLPGISLDGIPVRNYSGGFSQVLGYVGRASESDLGDRPYLLPVDFVGKDGIEAQYDQLLRGQNGVVETEVDASGRPIRTLREVPTKAGKDVRLTIDAGLQKHFMAVIASQMSKAGIKKAAGVALDAQTGEVLAMVSMPTFDNNLFSGGISQDDYDRLVSNPLQPMYNKVIAGTYPSGSTIKPMHLAGALQEGVVNEHTIIVDRGKIVVPSVYDPSVVYTFNGWNPNGLGPMDARRAIAMSSDIYFYTVGGGYQGFKGMGVDRLTSYYRKFGFGQLTGIDLPGEQAGIVPSPQWLEKTHNRSWVVGDTYNISIGQGDFAVTPLQLALATTAVANGGKLLKPYVLKQTEDGSVIKNPQIIRQDLVKPKYLQIAREGMREVITTTYVGASFASVPVAVAGKSGTAETDTANHRLPHAWFTAFAPYEHPKVVFAVLFEEGDYGSVFAAPVIARAMGWYFTHRKP